MALSLSDTIHVFLDSQINRGQVVASCSSPKQKGYIHSYKWFLRAAEADGKHILNFHSSLQCAKGLIKLLTLYLAH